MLLAKGIDRHFGKYAYLISFEELDEKVEATHIS